MKKILVLYRELAGYFVSCINHLAQSRNIQVDVVAYPVHPDAPFRFAFGPGIRILERSGHSAESLSELLRSGGYHLVFCGGWSDRDYLRAIRENPQVPSLLGFDKQWLGTVRDLAGAVWLRTRVTSSFDFAFVPGEEQFRFARRMGFRRKQIVSGAYAADVNLYSRVWEARTSSPDRMPRQIWFAGRYAQEKGISDLWDVMLRLLDGPLRHWEFHAIGTGPLWGKRPEHPRIFHHGFVQPSDVPALISGGQVFVLPSHYEPWGLALQEFAAAGFALIASDRVGARTAFLEEGVNGTVFQAGNREELGQQIIAMCELDSSTRYRMGRRSHQLARTINWETWSDALVRMMAGAVPERPVAP